MRFTALFGVVLVVGCATSRIHTEVTERGDLSHASTFAMVAQAPAAGDAPAAAQDDALAADVRAEIQRVLGGLGYLVAPADLADVLVSYQWIAESGGPLVNAGDPDADYYVPNTTVKTSLAIELTDRRSGAVVWRGVGRGEAEPSGSLIRTNLSSVATATVQKVLAQLPPAAR